VDHQQENMLHSKVGQNRERFRMAQPFFSQKQKWSAGRLGLGNGYKPHWRLNPGTKFAENLSDLPAKAASCDSVTNSP